MPNVSRRRFLAQVAAIPAVLFAARDSFANFDDGFDFLVVGDSLVWGQGLNEEEKFYSLTKRWLESEAFGRPIEVRINVKAHSGSTLTLHEDEEKALTKAGRDVNQFYQPEINVGFPSIDAQLEIAHREYKDPRSVRMIMMSGSITDISVAAILNPFGKNDQLRSDISKYSGDVMSKVLSRAAELFPNALIVVIGYFPMISSKTKTSDLFNFALEAWGVPRPLKPVTNNFMTRPILREIGQKALKRSRIWVELSNQKLQESVDGLNRRQGSTRAVFVKAPINEDNTYGTKDSLVFRMLKRGRIEDRKYDLRREKCEPILDDLKNNTGLKYPVKFCDMAAVGHPNPQGSKAFAESIKTVVTPLLWPQK